MDISNKFYIDIESLLDIRQGALSYLMTIDELTTYVNTEEYNTRQLDAFNVDMNEYNKIYNKKNINLLPRSTVTYNIYDLKKKINKSETANGLTGEFKEIEVYLNIYPFKLTKEQQDALVEMFFIKLDANCPITIISIPPKELTMFYIKALDISHVYIYDYKPWLSEHMTNIQANRLETTLFYFPSIMATVPTPEDEKNLDKLGFNDYFDYLEFILSVSINVNFLPICLYSNAITASVILEKLRKESINNLHTDKEEEDGNIGTKIQVP